LAPHLGAGHYIVYFEIADKRSEIWIIDTAGHIREQVTNSRTIPFWRNAGFLFPDWSRDGRSVVFTFSRRDLAHPNSSIGILSLEDGKFKHLRSLDSLGPWRPRWSPTRDEIVFFGCQSGSKSGYQVYLVETSGLRLRQLTDVYLAREADWSHDGSEIIFSAKHLRETPLSIWKVSRAGKDQSALVLRPPLSDSYPDW
jgi:Tol biopolymer transport system component